MVGKTIISKSSPLELSMLRSEAVTKKLLLVIPKAMNREWHGTCRRDNVVSLSGQNWNCDYGFRRRSCG